MKVIIKYKEYQELIRIKELYSELKKPLDLKTKTDVDNGFKEWWEIEGKIKIGELDVIDKNWCEKAYNVGYENNNISYEQFLCSSNMKDKLKNDYVNRTKGYNAFVAGNFKRLRI